MDEITQHAGSPDATAKEGMGNVTLRTAGRFPHGLPYSKPRLVRHANLRDITFECPNWQCSVVVPPPPSP